MPTSTQEVTFIPIEKVLEMRENNVPFILVEVLKTEDYKKEHLPGAISIPGADIEERAAELLPEKDQAIVVYCASFTCPASTIAARKLQGMGYTHVLDYKGSKKDWKERGLEMES